MANPSPEALRDDLSEYIGRQADQLCEVVADAAKAAQGKTGLTDEILSRADDLGPVGLQLVKGWLSTL